MGQPQETKPLTVMILDDDRTIRLILQEILSEYRVITAESCARFNELIRNERPHILFLDVTLTDGNGIEICRKLRGSPEHAGMMIILITSQTDTKSIKEGYAAGADDYIRKPFIPFEIKAKTAIMERIIRFAQELNDANAALERKNRKFYAFGLFIQSRMLPLRIQERLESSLPLQEIIEADRFEAVLLKSGVPTTVVSHLAASAQGGLQPGYAEIAAGIGTESRIHYAAVKKGSYRSHIVLLTVRDRGIPGGAILIQKDRPFDADDREIIAMYANFLDILSEREAVEEQVKENNEEYKREIQKIRTIQVSLMPHFKDIEQYDIASAYLPAKELSGDFIDAYRTDDGTLQIVVCDVSGHGIAASYVGNEFRTVFRLSSLPGIGPAEIAGTVNEATVRDLKDLYYFSTVILCQIRLSSGKIRYVNAGHPSPVLFRGAAGTVELLPPTGPLVGLFGGQEYREREISLEPGDCLFLYTDGITEACADHDRENAEMFGIERLGDIVAENREYPSRDILHFVISSVYEFSDYQDQKDDITAVCIKRR
ncbi:MAG: fused response regulator/phosphatase [Spirochaetes bacterium]|nr:fused response regulator/phosphatase [Spirochaetota bacterium]